MWCKIAGMAVYLSSYLLMEIIVKEFTCTMFSVAYFLENLIVQLLHGVLVQVTFHAAFLFPFFFPLGLLKLSLVVSAWYISHLFREKLIEYTVVYFLQCIRSNVWYCNMLFYGMCVLAGAWCASWVICPSKLCCINTEIDSRSAFYNFYVYIIFNVKTSYLQKPFFFLNIFTAAFYSVSCRY